MYEPGNRSNSSNAHSRVLLFGKLATGLFEAFVLTEILWYYLTDGTQTFHGAVREWLDDYADRVVFTREVTETQMMIRRLPER